MYLFSPFCVVHLNLLFRTTDLIKGGKDEKRSGKNDRLKRNKKMKGLRGTTHTEKTKGLRLTVQGEYTSLPRDPDMGSIVNVRMINT